MLDFQKEFIQFAIARNVLRFGEFKTKAGRLSPYFFNSGLFNDGDSLRLLGEFYAKAILAAAIPFNILFGPAYKGIPLVSSIAIALSNMGYNYPYCFNRKEVKDHGEGGFIVGATLSGKVLIVDDVISAGTSVHQSVDLINANNASPAGVVIALDRMERGTGQFSAVQEVNQKFGIPVTAIVSLNNLIEYLRNDNSLHHHLNVIECYRNQYGVN